MRRTDSTLPGMMRAAFVALLFVGTGCSALRSSFVRGDWEQTDQRQLKRLAIVVSPLPENRIAVAQALGRIARRYVNQKRDFLAKFEVAHPSRPPLSELCAAADHIDGVLFLTPNFTREGAGFEVEMNGSLVRCTDGREAWSASAASSFASEDSGLKEVTHVYEQEFGDEVVPFIAPGLNILRPLLDTLPQPALEDADVEEKLTLD